MGILNVTADSFFDGGKYNSPETALEHAHKLLEDGADIIDVGVVSSRPGASLLSPEVEAERLTPIIHLLRKELPTDTPISVDTCFSLPARRAVEAGAQIVNDISGGRFDKLMFSTVAELQVHYILMHSKSTPKKMQDECNTHYDDIIGEITDYFSYRLSQLRQLGVEHVWIDPGFGFAKTMQQNHFILHHLDELVKRFHDTPLMTALSNKSMISHLVGSADSPLGTTILNTIALAAGSRVLRVHDPHDAKVAIKLLFPSFPEE